MNNKRLGTEWEREFCSILNGMGFWVHFISPDNSGAQPFDVIAVKEGNAYAFDCKTSSSTAFRYDRLEFNQQYAFHKWIDCGNTEPMIVVKYKRKAYLIPLSKLERDRIAYLDLITPWYDLDRQEIIDQKNEIKY